MRRSRGFARVSWRLCLGMGALPSSRSRGSCPGAVSGHSAAALPGSRGRALLARQPQLERDLVRAFLAQARAPWPAGGRRCRPAAAGSSGRSMRTRGGVWWAMRASRSPIESASNGRRPISSSNSSTPSAYRSHCGVGVGAGQLLGRHVGRRAQHDAAARGGGVGHAGRAEVGDLDGARGRVEQDVGRLDVAVDDAGAVRQIQRQRDALADADDDALGQQAVGAGVARHVGAVHPFHRQPAGGGVALALHAARVHARRCSRASGARPPAASRRKRSRHRPRSVPLALPMRTVLSAISRPVPRSVAW